MAHKIPNNRRSVAFLIGACTACGIPGARAAVTFEPRIGADLAWTDNVELAPPGTAKQDSLIGQVRPGLRLSVDGVRWQAYADYEAQALYFADDSDKSSVYHTGSLGSQLELLQEWLFLDVAGERTQMVVDPAAPTNLENMFQVGNTADATTAQITPILQHRFRLAELEASYTRGLVNYSEAPETEDVSAFNLDDSTNESSSFALRSPDPEARMTWETRYRRDKVEYDLALPYEYETALAEVAVRVAPSWQLIANGGLESDPNEGVRDGGLEEPSYQGGFAYRPNASTELRLMAGHRFFGTTYDGIWRYTGRLIESDVEYHESPTTQTQSYAVRSITAPGDFPSQLDPTFSRTTADVYLLKQLSGRIGMRGRVTEIYLGLTSEKRQYFGTGLGEDVYRGVSVEAARRLGPRLRLEARGGIDDATLREGIEYRQHTYSLSLIRQIGTATALTLSGNHFDRTGGAREYDANWVMLGVEVAFGGRGPGAGTGGARRPVLPTRSSYPTIPGRR